MKKFALLPILLLLVYYAKAQDKIISLTHDTIHCTIVSITNERILYELKNTDGSVTGKLMPLSEVLEYSKAHQTEAKSKNIKQEVPKSNYIPEYIPVPPFRLGLSAGRSTMPWYFDNYPYSTAMPDFYDKLKTGFHLKATAHYMLVKFLGVGVEYSFFTANSSGTTQRQYASSIFALDSEKYRLFTNYLGASVLFQQHLGAHRKFILSESLSAGVMFVRLENQNTFPNVTQTGYNNLSNNVLQTGNTFTGKFGLSAEYKFFKAVSVGLSGDFLWSTLKRARYEMKGPNNYSFSKDDQKLTNAMKLSRFDYSVALRYHF